MELAETGDQELFQELAAYTNCIRLEQSRKTCIIWNIAMAEATGENFQTNIENKPKNATLAQISEQIGKLKRWGSQAKEKAAATVSAALAIALMATALLPIEAKAQPVSTTPGEKANTTEYFDGDPMRLTEDGARAKSLYELYRDTPGWWNKKGSFTPQDFVKLMLSYELGPLKDANEQVTDDGFKVKDLVAEASTRWINMQCLAVMGRTCARPSENAFYQWIGAGSDSFNKRWNAMYLNENNQLIKPQPEKLGQITRDEGRNPALADYVMAKILNPPDPKWTIATGIVGYTGPSYWGNMEMLGKTPPSNPLYRFGSGSTAFYIINQEQANQ